jgi:hypothetical protein
MTSREFVSLVVAALVLFMAAWLLVEFFPHQESDVTIRSFDECVARGNPVMESFPRQCITPDGRSFVEDIATAAPETSDDGIVFEGCVVAGCGGNLCVSAVEAATIFTTCEYRPEYACYKAATCDMQADGMCGWTETPELQACLANPPAIEDSELQPI